MAAMPARPTLPEHCADIRANSASVQSPLRRRPHFILTKTDKIHMCFLFSRRQEIFRFYLLCTAAQSSFYCDYVSIRTVRLASVRSASPLEPVLCAVGTERRFCAISRRSRVPIEGSIDHENAHFTFSYYARCRRVAARRLRHTADGLLPEWQHIERVTMPVEMGCVRQ